MGLKLKTLKSRVARSTDRASQVPLEVESHFKEITNKKTKKQTKQTKQVEIATHGKFSATAAPGQALCHTRE